MQIFFTPALMPKGFLCPEQNLLGLYSLLRGFTCLQLIWKVWHLEISANLIHLLQIWRKNLPPTPCSVSNQKH